MPACVTPDDYQSAAFGVAAGLMLLKGMPVAAIVTCALAVIEFDAPSTGEIIIS